MALEESDTDQRWLKWTLAASAVLALTVFAFIFLPANLAERPYWPGHVAFTSTGLAFLRTDVLELRVLATVGNIFTAVFSYYNPVGQALYLPFFWSIFYTCVNSFKTVMLLRERFVYLTKRERSTYVKFFKNVMTEPDFAKLIHGAALRTADQREMVLTKGTPAAALYLVVEPAAEVHVGDDVPPIRVPSGMMGEVAFLQKTNASATVHVLAGCVYYAWSYEAMAQLAQEAPAAHRGLQTTIGYALAKKLGETNQHLQKQASLVKQATTGKERLAALVKMSTATRAPAAVEASEAPTTQSLSVAQIAKLLTGKSREACTSAPEESSSEASPPKQSPKPSRPRSMPSGASVDLV